MNNSEKGREKKLPARASLEHLRKQAKRRVQQNPSLKLAEVQHQLAREYGCRNWVELVRIVESRLSPVKPDDIFMAIHRGNGPQLATLLDAHPALLHERFDHMGTAPWIDMSVRASFRLSGEAVRDVTPLEHAVRILGEENGSPEKQRVLELLHRMDRKTQLKNAIRQGDSGTVNRLLDADPTLLEVDLWPPAVYEAKSLAMTRLLLDRGLNPNRCSAPRLPLHLSVYQVLPEMIECLLNAGADSTMRNPLGETPLDLLDAYEPRPIGDPDVHRIKALLLAAGAEMDFLCAVRLGDARHLEALLEGGAPVHPDALHAAARSGRPEAAAVLLRHGADPNRVNDKKNTPLWFAAQSPALYDGRIAVMKQLLQAGADLHQRCERGSTALHFAAWRGPVQVVEFLLSQGARTGEVDDNGKTPIDDALMSPESKDREAIVNLLGAPFNEAG